MIVIHINNGNFYAEHLAQYGLLQDGMSLEQCEKALRDNCIVVEASERILKRDDFWEDFEFRAAELGYMLKV